MEKMVVDLAEEKQNLSCPAMCREVADLAESYTVNEIIRIVNRLTSKICDNYRNNELFV